VIQGELRLRASWCWGGDPGPWKNDAPSLAGAFKNPLNLKTPAFAVFSPDHPPPRRKETYRWSIYMLNLTYEDDIKIKYKQVAGISRISKETISMPPQSREKIPFSQGI
jgi:hypothetical protein